MDKKQIQLKEQLTKWFDDEANLDKFVQQWNLAFPKILEKFTTDIQNIEDERSLLSSSDIENEKSKLINKILKDQLSIVIDDSGLKDEIAEIEFGKSNFQTESFEFFRKKTTFVGELTEENGEDIQVLTDKIFENWGLTVKNTPYLTCFPKTKKGICNIVKYAKEKNKTVRVSGYRHTWSDLYSSDRQILISILPLKQVTQLPDWNPPIDPDNKLQYIELREENPSILVTVGAATTNSHLRTWCMNDKDGRKYTIPLNVIMSEITFGGSNAPICHGAGLRNQTLSDLVYEIEFVNANGELQKVNDSNQLKAAAGCFGLLGIVTEITFKFDHMTYARMQPERKKLALTIPPPNNFKLPSTVQKISLEESDQAWKDFVLKCENSYYSEWFWFPLQEECWINCWDNNGRPSNAVNYPNKWEIGLQAFGTLLMGVINSFFFKGLAGLQTKIIGGSAMQALPHGEVITTQLIQALHFQHGIQNMRVLDMEFEIPIPARKDDPTKPDWAICQKAWWHVINNVYERYNQNRRDLPMRLALEMRIMGGSNILLAPQYKNKFGTCSIEILTPINVDKKEWHQFMQEVIDSWASLKDSEDRFLNIRPHWAKQWQNLIIRDIPIEDYLKNSAYKEVIPEFKQIIMQITREAGSNWDESMQLFAPALFKRLFDISDEKDQLESSNKK